MMTSPSSPVIQPLPPLSPEERSGETQQWGQGPYREAPEGSLALTTGKKERESESRSVVCNSP